MTAIAIIGAGLAGLTLAHRLQERARVTLFDKSRGVGGRMATRRAPPYEFDHGAQFFTARSTEFRAFLQPLIEVDVVANWTPVFAELDRDRIRSERRWDDDYPHFVAQPAMNRLGKYLARGLDVRNPIQVDDVQRVADSWVLYDQDGAKLGAFDWVVSTAPAAQAANLMPQTFAHGELIEKVQMLGCYALMLGFASPLPLGWQAALVRNADISWISINSSKPGRPDAFSMVVHSTNRWAEAHLGDEPAAVEQHLLEEVSAVIGHDVAQADHRRLHRWRYANIVKQSGERSLIDPANRLAACGDWCVRGRVEAAFTSATSLAEKMRRLL